MTQGTNYNLNVLNKYLSGVLFIFLFTHSWNRSLLLLSTRGLRKDDTVWQPRVWFVLVSLWVCGSKEEAKRSMVLPNLQVVVVLIGDGRIDRRWTKSCFFYPHYMYIREISKIVYKKTLSCNTPLKLDAILRAQHVLINVCVSYSIRLTFFLLTSVLISWMCG